MSLDSDLIVFFSDFSEVAEFSNNELLVIFDSEYNSVDNFGSITSDVNTYCYMKNKDIINLNIEKDNIVKIRSIEYKIKNIEENSNEISIVRLKRA
jgi:hypothetical protein